MLGFVAVAAGCSGALAPGNAETDRIAKVVSDAISYPRQDSAAGYARAALATRAGQAGRLRVVAIEELRADELGDPLGDSSSWSIWKGPKPGGPEARR